jgi:hypothetical protein
MRSCARVANLVWVHVRGKHPVATLVETSNLTSARDGLGHYGAQPN